MREHMGPGVQQWTGHQFASHLSGHGSLAGANVVYHYHYTLLIHLLQWLGSGFLRSIPTKISMSFEKKEGPSFSLSKVGIKQEGSINKSF